MIDVYVLALVNGFSPEKQPDGTLAIDPRVLGFAEALRVATAEDCAKICYQVADDAGGVSAGPLATDFGKAIFQAQAAGAKNSAAAIRSKFLPLTKPN